MENFETASTTLSGDLLTSVITGATLTPEQIASITSLGETMGNELLAGISASFDKSASYLTMLFGGLDSAATDDEYAGAILLADTMYENLVGQAEQLGREFGETLGTAMDDGIITGNEYNVIMEKMQAYNDAISAENDSLNTDEGVEAEARAEYGWVEKGDQSALVTNAGDNGSGSKLPAQPDLESIKAPQTWY